MKKQLSILKIMLVALFSIFSLTFTNAQEFDYTITDPNMTVQVSADICASVMETGDLLGAFFTNSAGDLQNAGYQEFVGDQLAIAVWASEAGLGNGMAAGEVIQWAMYDTSEGVTVLLDAEMSATPPFSDTFVSNGFGQVLSLSVSSGDDCADDDSVVAAFGGCAGAVAALGCDFVFAGVPINESCPATCDSCSGSAFIPDMGSPENCPWRRCFLGKEGGRGSHGRRGATSEHSSYEEDFDLESFRGWGD